MSGNFFTGQVMTKIVAAVAIAGFVFGGGYSVYKHEQSLAQPVVAAKPLAQVVNLSGNITASKLKTAAPAPKKDVVANKATTPGAPVVAPSQAPMQQEPVNVPAPELVTAPADAVAPESSQPTVSVEQVPEQAPSVPVNAEPPAPDPQPAAPPADPARVLISEILFNPAGSDAGHEFVELYNAGGTDADLKDWSLIIQNATSSPTGSSLAKLGHASSSWPEDKITIKAHGFLLIGLNRSLATADADVNRTASMWNTASTIYLKDENSNQIDAVAYDGATPEGDSVARENYSGDFKVEAIPTPQGSGN